MSKENQLIQCKLAWRAKPTEVVPLREVDEAVRKALDPAGTNYASACTWYAGWNPGLVECLARQITWDEIRQANKDRKEQVGGDHDGPWNYIEDLANWFEANVIVSFVTRELTDQEISEVVLTRLMCEALGVPFDASAMVEALQAHPSRGVR